MRKRDRIVSVQNNNNNNKLCISSGSRTRHHMLEEKQFPLSTADVPSIRRFTNSISWKSTKHARVVKQTLTNTAQGFTARFMTLSACLHVKYSGFIHHCRYMLLCADDLFLLVTHDIQKTATSPSISSLSSSEVGTHPISQRLTVSYIFLISS